MNKLLLIWVKYFKFILISFLLVNNSLASLKIDNSASKKIISTKIEIRKITPPKLYGDFIEKKVIYHKPMRTSSPRIDIQKIDGKVIAHNYGHGGSGWTLAPGITEYVNTRLLESRLSKDLNYNTPITIVGAGAIGLFTAYDLINRGYINITIISDRFENLTSHNAGGLLAPISINNDEEVETLINKVGIDSYKFYESIALNFHTDFPDGAKIMPAYFTDRESSGLEPYVGIVMEEAKDVILDFGNGTHRRMVAYDDGIFIDTSILMKRLKEFLENKIEFEKRHISCFSEIKTKYIINCTGIGSKDLNKDDKLISVQGHLIMLKNQNPADFDHMIFMYLNRSYNKYKQKVRRAFYVFPKKSVGSLYSTIGALGGSFIEGADKKTPNNEEFDHIIQNAKIFYGLD